MKNQHNTALPMEAFEGIRIYQNSRINLNSASLVDMMKLPDIDKETANDIINFAKDTVITDSFDLLELESIDTYLLHSWNQKICDMRVDLNRIDEIKLQKVKDVGKKLAKKIMEKKRVFGHFSSISQLKLVEGINSATLDKLKSRVKV